MNTYIFEGRGRGGGGAERERELFAEIYSSWRAELIVITCFVKYAKT